MFYRHLSSLFFLGLYDLGKRLGLRLCFLFSSLAFVTSGDAAIKSSWPN